ncbi:hypothetical protein [Serratia marcescens]|uniref:hypothetical protein n=1 Tax=Serratia marcescens TaxID=615 RepID=UPI001116E40D|nr:hypothetical protein [Serratia marcescens]
MTNYVFNAALLEMPSRVSVIDPCPYGREGWHYVFQSTNGKNNPSDVFVAESILDLHANPIWLDCIHTRLSSPHYLILRLPSHAQQAILMVLQLGEFTPALLHFQCLVVITPFSQNATRHILACSGIQRAVPIVIGRHPLRDLRHYILLLSRQTICSRPYPKKNLSEEDDYLMLTSAERKVLRQTLSEIPMYRQVRLNNSLTKTIYSQRRSALLKFGVRSVLDLLRVFICNKYKD